MTPSQTVGYERSFSRSEGLLTRLQQETLRNSCVSLAGCGGDGGLLAERLARAGVGELRLADPEGFEQENLNRQFGCTVETIGCNKAEVVAETLSAINPELRIVVYREGLTENNASAFVDGAEVVVDELEYSLPSLSLLLGRSARDTGAALVTGANIGFGACVFSFRPDGMTIEDYYRAKKADNGYFEVDALAPIRALCPRIPSYVPWATLKAIMDGTRPVPSVSQAVAAVAAVVSQEVVGHLCGLQELVCVPRYIELDLLRRSMRVRRASGPSFYMSLMRCRLASRGDH